MSLTLVPAPAHCLHESKRERVDVGMVINTCKPSIPEVRQEDCELKGR